MQLPLFTAVLAATASVCSAATIDKRQNGFNNPQFENGQPINGQGKGGIISGGTNKELDLQNPSNLGQQSTDAGFVPNLKWSFSDSKTRIFNGGWVREQVINDLPASHDIAGAQVHLNKGAIRELHWHRTAEWGYVYAGSFIISAVNEEGKYEVDTLEVGDIWYFPKGQAHSIQGLEDANEFLVIFDDGDFEKVGTTFMIDDWISHTPKSILAKNFGVNETVFNSVPSPFPYITNGTVSTQQNITGPAGALVGNSSYVYHSQDHELEAVPGQGGTFRKVDSTTFPIAKTIAAAIVTLEPGGLRELHWHPNAEEWLYFHQGHARASVFIGNSNARTFDFSAGDTAVFPDNSGHYIENTSDTEELVWIEIYKSERVADISLTQWLALTPHDIAATVLKVPVEVIENLKKEKQLLLKGS
ncbi:putative oxalate decarboxylase oxdC [Pseudovirgaria hyperparasitica]|uniref:Putative oxalate decarboxylase oxdC n=1 Tax=Pseudovirgaria hyperparasitica TaxID=470096 RepID=A0A6A6W1E3_9PEZI|nr:putative oxalate decarboxylase oxdC [Pseudovirgaria hyperparasitica]KAF2756738.1 putative oxalate decarboxylase oxdC [Pseudovirgaria hyperparasitica]